MGRNTITSIFIVRTRILSFRSAKKNKILYYLYLNVCKNNDDKIPTCIIVNR